MGEAGAVAAAAIPSSDPPSDLAGVRTLAVLLVKVAKMIALYPPTSALPVRAVQDLSSAVAAVLKEKEAVRFVVGRGKLYHGGEEVLVEGDDADSLSGRLFRDRVREFTFHRGVTDEELLRFLGLFRARESSRDAETDDLATLLWETEFSFITFVVLDDVFSFGGGTDAVPEEFQVELTTSAETAIYDFDDEPGSAEETSSMAEMFRSRLRGGDVGLFGVSGDERQALLREWEEEDGEAEQLAQFRRIVQEILRPETSEADFAALLEIVGYRMRASLEVGDLGELARLVALLDSIAHDRSDLTPAMQEAIEARIHETWDSTAQWAYIDHLDVGNPLALEGLGPLCESLPDEAMRTFCGVLGELQTATARKRTIHVLAERARGQCHPFIPFLKDERWYLVRNIALILGLIGDQRAFRFLAETIQHPDFRVRKEVLGSLENLDPKGTAALLIDALGDSDPRMRILAARSLSTQGRTALEPIASILDDKQFSKREPAEIRTFYEAYAYAGREQAVPKLEEVARRKNPLRSRQTDETRAAACRALGWAGGARSTVILRELEQDRSALVRDAARAGLRRLASGSAQTRREEEAA